MYRCKSFLREYLSVWAAKTRKGLGCTQEKMAERLHISIRSYNNLERGKSGFAAPTLLFFLCLLPEDQVLELVRGFRDWCEEEQAKTPDRELAYLEK